MRRSAGAWRVSLSALLLSLVSYAGFLFTDAGLGTALTAAATAAAVLLVCRTVVDARAVVAAPRVPNGRVRTAIRDRERRTAFLPQRDPDAAGRPRPRAPGRRAVTAA